MEAEEKQKVKVEYKFPKTLGECVDRAYKLRAQRLELERKADTIKSEESALKDHVLESFNKADIEGARGKVATASITTKTVAQVEDWDKFYAYIHKNKAYEMLQRRVSDTAFRERLEAKKTVPGVKPFNVLGLSLTKR